MHYFFVRDIYRCKIVTGNVLENIQNEFECTNKCFKRKIIGNNMLLLKLRLAIMASIGDDISNHSLLVQVITNCNLAYS